MPDALASLWPEDIKVEVLPPVVILRAQAAEIGRITKGILKGEISTTTGVDDFVAHRLDLVAPALGGRRFGVLNATHRADIYPVVIEAECFKPPPQRVTAADLLAPALPGVFNLANLNLAPPPWPDPNDWRPVANNVDEFVARVREVLRSGKVRAAIDTLLALSNEKAAAERGEPADPAA